MQLAKEKLEGQKSPDFYFVRETAPLKKKF